MDDVTKQLEAAAQTSHLVLIFFYVDWAPHYNWLEPAINEYEKRVVELIEVNIETDKAVADSYNIGTVPAFVLLHRGKELWRQIGELTVDQLRLVLSEFWEIGEISD